jgi:Protein of unknown function (DUF1488)
LQRSATGSFNILRRCTKSALAGYCQRIDQSHAVSALRSEKLWPSKYLGADRAQAGTGLVHWQLDRFQPMIAFPNYSRSYDRTRHAVRFWGYDSAMEASFFINEAALRYIQPDTRPDEAGFLNAFDSNRDLICAAAAKVYVRGSRGSYDLVAHNF